MTFSDYCKVLVLKFSGMGNTAFFQLKSWWKDDMYWLLKSSCFEPFGDRKYSIFFRQKNWWRDNIFLGFLRFPWYSRTWEIWFFLQWMLLSPLTSSPLVSSSSILKSSSLLSLLVTIWSLNSLHRSFSMSVSSLF